MARGRRLRKDAATDLEAFQAELGTLGGLVGDALEAHSATFFALADDVLSDASSPTTWFQTGLASLVRCCETQLGLYHKICEALGPASNEGGATLTIRNNIISFSLDRYTETAGPFETDLIPIDQIDNVKPTDGPTLAPHIRLSVSGDDVVLIGLVGLGGVNPPVPPGTTQTTTLSWDGGKTTVVVMATRAPPPGGLVPA